MIRDICIDTSKQIHYRLRHVIILVYVFEYKPTVLHFRITRKKVFCSVDDIVQVFAVIIVGGNKLSLVPAMEMLESCKDRV